MQPLPLAARVVEVIADQGVGCTPRFRCGSGCLVAGRTVLTAAHIVVGAVSVVVRGPDKITLQAAVDPRFIGDVEGPGPDLALIEVIGGAVGVPTMGLAAAGRDSPAGDPVERCHVIGYPAFMERRTVDGGRFRETADAFGHVPVLSGLARGLLSVQVSSSTRPLPRARRRLGDSPWSGMSGGPVVADGLLLGVVTEHAPRAGASAITATPLTALEPDPAHPGWGPGVANPGAWWARLGVADAKQLKRLPATPRRSRSAYWATVQEIRKRSSTLTGRQNELSDIASFAAGDEAYRWLVGEAWTGKTALLAEAVTAPPGNVDVVCYFLSRREADADSSRFLAAVVPMLARLLDEDPPAAELHQFRALWQRGAERAAATGRHLLLVVDGLDEDLRPPGLPSVAALLPAGAGGRSHVLVSSRPHPELPPDIPAGHPLRHVRPVAVEPFSGARELAVLARQEIDDLLRRDHDGLAADVLGLLTAAAGPLAARDLAAMTIVAPQSAALARRIRWLLTSSAARSLQAVGVRGTHRYQFAHESLLAYAQADDDLNHPDFRRRIHQWAEEWKTADWPIPAGGEKGTPQYLLDTYVSTLAHEPQRLAQLASDAGWVEAAITSASVDRVLADLRRAAAANPESTAVAAVLAAATRQAHNLRPPQPLDQPGYILRQLCMQAIELGEDDLAENIRSRLQSRPGACLVPQWTTRPANRALSAELGRHDGPVQEMELLADGRVVTAGRDRRVLVWDPAQPGTGPLELGHHDVVNGMVVLSDGQVITTGRDGYRGRLLVWDPAQPGTDPIELGRHDSVNGMAVMPDGRVVTGDEDGQVLVWHLARPGAHPVELGRRKAPVQAVAVLADGRVVTRGLSWGMLVWDPARPGTDPIELGRHDSVNRMTALSDGRVVTGGGGGRVLVWDPALPGGGPAELGRHDGPVWEIAVLVDGRVVTAGRDERVLVWDPARPGTDPAELGRHSVDRMAVLPDGRVVTAGRDGRVLVWDPARSGTGWAELGRREAPVRAVALLTDGRVVTGGEDGRVLVWDPAQPKTGPAELGRREASVRAVAVLADGRIVTGGGDGRVMVWDPARPRSGPAELGRREAPVVTVAVLPDGRIVTGGADYRVLAWDSAGPRNTDPVELGCHDEMVQAVAVLADGRVVTGSDDRWVLVWEPSRPGTSRAELGRCEAPVLAVAVMADGRVVTGSEDGRVLVWDPARPETGPVELGRHDGTVLAVAVLADGRVVSGGEDHRVLVWDSAGTTTHVQLSCSVRALATTPLSPARSSLVVAHQGSGFSLWSLTVSTKFGSWDNAHL